MNILRVSKSITDVTLQWQIGNRHPILAQILSRQNPDSLFGSVPMPWGYCPDVTH